MKQTNTHTDNQTDPNHRNERLPFIAFSSICLGSRGSNILIELGIRSVAPFGEPPEWVRYADLPRTSIKRIGLGRYSCIHPVEYVSYVRNDWPFTIGMIL